MNNRSLPLKSWCDGCILAKRRFRYQALRKSKRRLSPARRMSRVEASIVACRSSRVARRPSRHVACRASRVAQATASHVACRTSPKPPRRMSHVACRASPKPPRRMSHVARRTSHRVARRTSHVAQATASHVARRTSHTPLPYWGNHPRPPPNKYNASFGKKCVTNAHATFFVTFDDFGNARMQVGWYALPRSPWPSRRSALPWLRGHVSPRARVAARGGRPTTR